MRNSEIVSSLITSALVAITLGASMTPAHAAGKNSTTTTTTTTSTSTTWQACWQRFLDATSGGKDRRDAWVYDGTCSY